MPISYKLRKIASELELKDAQTLFEIEENENEQISRYPLIIFPGEMRFSFLKHGERYIPMFIDKKGYGVYLYPVASKPDRFTAFNFSLEKDSNFGAGYEFSVDHNGNLSVKGTSVSLEIVAYPQKNPQVKDQRYGKTDFPFNPLVENEVELVSSSNIHKDRRGKDEKSITTDFSLNMQHDSIKISQISFWQRFYESTFGFHKYRFLAGVLLLTSFLMVLFTPSLLPFSALSNFMQQTLIPGIAAMGLGIAAKGVVAIVGSFLALTAPKWIGNVCQFIGDKLIRALLGRIALIPIWVLGLLVESCCPGAPNHRIGKLLIIPLIDILLIAVNILNFLGKTINYLGCVIAGEYGYKEYKVDKVNPSSVCYTIKSLGKALNQTGDAKSIAKEDPAVFFPEARLKLVEKYVGWMNWFAEKSPLPALKEIRGGAEMDNRNINR